MPVQNSRNRAATVNTRNKSRYEDQEDFEEYEKDNDKDEFEDTFVSGYDEDYEEDEDIDETIFHNRREAVKSMGGHSRVNKVTDRKERSVTGKQNRATGYRQRSGATTPKARKDNVSNK